MATSFWCNECRKHTHAAPDGSDSPRCGVCWDFYQCDECGYEINRAGDCLRPPDPDGPSCPASVVRPD